MEELTSENDRESALEEHIERAYWSSSTGRALEFCTRFAGTIASTSTTFLLDAWFECLGFSSLLELGKIFKLKTKKPFQTSQLPVEWTAATETIVTEKSFSLKSTKGLLKSSGGLPRRLFRLKIQNFGEYMKIFLFKEWSTPIVERKSNGSSLTALVDRFRWHRC